MSWTDDRVETLKKLWGEGKTAAEIAKVLGNVTRNAVIGKAHRLKLSNRVSPIQQNNKKSSVSAVKTQPVSKPVFAAKKTVSVSAQKTGRVALIDLKPHECRWADGDPREAGFGFCGASVLPGLPYCSEHAKIAYQAATRNRILKAEQSGVDTATSEDPAVQTRKAAG